MDNFNRNTDLFAIEVDEHAKATFLEMARWTKFLAILGFITLALLVVGGLFAAAFTAAAGFNSPLSTLGVTGILLTFAVIVLICFYPFYGMLKYSVHMKAAVATQDKIKFNTAVVYLKNVFKFYGIISIIMLGMYGLMLILGIIINFLK